MAKDEMTATLQRNAAPEKRRMLAINPNQISESLKGTLEGIAHTQRFSYLPELRHTIAMVRWGSQLKKLVFSLGSSTLQVKSPEGTPDAPANTLNI